MTEDEMVTPGNSEGQGGLVCCSPGGWKSLGKLRELWTGRPGVLQFMGSQSRTRLSD